jgi:cobalamin-dependent methionine synthase I
MDMGIVNAGMIEVYDEINPKDLLRQVCEDVYPEPTTPMPPTELLRICRSASRAYR